MRLNAHFVFGPRALRTTAILAPLAFAFFANAVRADNSKFLFEVLHANKSTYRVAWNKLMKLVQPTPDWLVQFNKDFDGVAGQVNNVTIDGKPYSVSFVCKPTDCAAHQFVVLFDEKGARAVWRARRQGQRSLLLRLALASRAGRDGERGQGVTRKWISA